MRLFPEEFNKLSIDSPYGPIEKENEGIAELPL